MIKIEQHIYEDLVALTKKHLPNEASAFLFQDNEIVVPAEAEERSPGHFAGVSPLKTAELIKEYGTPSSLFHSHPCAAIPSSTDKVYMKPTIAIYKCPWLIMSNDYNLRAWTLDAEGKAQEMSLVIV